MIRRYKVRTYDLRKPRCGASTSPPNQRIPDNNFKFGEMMQIAKGTLQDDTNAISSHRPGVKGGFPGKIVMDGNLSTLLCPNPSQIKNAHFMQ